MTYNKQFEEIRPFNDSEVPGVINRIIQEKGFIKFVKFFFPDVPTDQFLKQLTKIKTIQDFQENFEYGIAEKIIKQSTSGLTHSGLENLPKNQSYLFLSNHRDIVLDSALLNKTIYDNGFKTTETAIGSNLLMLRWIKDLVKLTKAFIVKRNIPRKEFYHYTILLSQYIRYTLTEKKTSIWLAQREGRTKNGDDKTNSGLIKMLNIAGEGNIVDNYKQLNIVPVCISYEYEPCGIDKVKELYNKKKDENYKKTRLDDLMSMSRSMSSYKGHIHIAFAKPLNEELDFLQNIKKRQDRFTSLATLIDEKIYEMYKLHPVNYIAANEYFNTDKFTNLYTPEQKENFEARIEKEINSISGDNAEQRKMLLEIYAKPVENNLKTKS